MLKIKVVSLFALLGAILFLSAGVQTASAAAQTYQHRYAGKGAYGGWEQCVGDICTYTSIYVADTVYRADGTKFKNRTLSYSTSTFDQITGVYQSTYGYVENPTFAIDRKLASASVSGMVPVVVCTYDPITWEENCVDGGSVQVAAQWTAIGELIRGSNTGRWMSKTYTSIYHNRGSWRDAAAAATVNGASLGQLSWGQIFDMRDASVFVCRGAC